MKTYVGFLMIAASLSCGNPEPTDKAAMSVPVEHIDPTQAQKQRRAQSETYCKAHGIPVYSNPNAMFLDDDSQVTLRTKDEVVDRALALCYIGLKSEGLEQSKLDVVNGKYHITGKLSPAEQDYVNVKNPTEQQKINAN